MRRVNAGRRFGAAPSAAGWVGAAHGGNLGSTSHRRGLVRPGVLLVRPHKATVVRPFMQMKRDQLPQPRRISIYHLRCGRALLHHLWVHLSGMCCDTTCSATGHCCVIPGFTPASEIPPAPRQGIAGASRFSPRPVRYHPRRDRALQQQRGGLCQVRRARSCQLRCGWSF